MRYIDPDELDVILYNHSKWLESCGADGERADLSYGNLVGYSLHGVDLRFAILVGTNMRHSDLSGANLSGAFMVGANTDGANTLGTLFSEEL